MPTCVVPVTTAGKRVRVRVWDDYCQGYDQGDEVAKWLSTFLEEVRGAQFMIREGSCEKIREYSA